MGGPGGSRFASPTLWRDGLLRRPDPIGTPRKDMVGGTSRAWLSHAQEAVQERVEDVVVVGRSRRGPGRC